jgi:hypothetical protein
MIQPHMDGATVATCAANEIYAAASEVVSGLACSLATLAIQPCTMDISSPTTASTQPIQHRWPLATTTRRPR